MRWLRLELEEVPQLRSVAKGTAWNQVEEVFYTVADLDGTGFCLAQDRAASCFGNGEDNLHFGLDVRRLVEEGLLDEVYPYKWDHLDGAHRREWDITYFAAFCRPRGVRLSPVLTSGYEFETQVRDALSFYDQGADSVSYWDASGMWRDMRQWSVMARMDRPAELQARAGRGPEPEPVRGRLHRVNGQVVDGRYPPYMGG